MSNMEVDHSLDDYNNDSRDSNMSAASVKKYFLNEKGILRTKKTNYVCIANESKYDLIIVLEIDHLATHLADGKKLDKSKDGIPVTHTVPAGITKNLEIKTKVSYFTALRKHPMGYYVIRSKKYLKRSSKWTATNTSVEKSSVDHVEESFLYQLTSGNNSTVVNPSHQGSATHERQSSVDDEPRIRESLREQLLQKEANKAKQVQQQQLQSKHPHHHTHNHHQDGDNNSVEEGGSDDEDEAHTESSAGGQTEDLARKNSKSKKTSSSSCCGCCCC